ncbi:MAG: DMT family transporter [Calditrichota bacterium]
MTGFLFAALTGLFFGLQGSYSRYISKKLSFFALTCATILSAIPVLMIFLYSTGIPQIDVAPFLLATLTSFTFNLFAIPLFFRALSVSPLYLTMPFTAFTPLFLVPIAWLTLGEWPDKSGFAGIFLILAGVYFIYLRDQDWLSPFRGLMKESGSRYMLIVAVLWSVSGTVEKNAVLASSAAFYGLTVHILLAICFTGYLFIRQPQELASIKRFPKQLLIMSLISGLMVICQLTALTMLPVSYVLSFKRSGILVSIALGYWFLNEPDPRRNLTGAFMVVIGAILLML